MQRLYNKDCLEVLKGLDAESIDLVVTDCPYHIVSGGCSNDAVKIREYCGGMLRKYKKDGHGNTYYTDSKHVSWPGVMNDADPSTYTKQGKLFKHNDIKFSEWLPEVYRILKPNTHCYVMINARNLKELQQDAEDAGFIYQQILVWDKGNNVPNKYYMNSYELVLMLRKGRAKNINNMGTSNILRIPNILKVKKHPTEKPPELMKVMIENSSQEGDTVLDPFMGVGGTGVACKECNRNFIGIEIDEKYYTIAAERLNKKPEEQAQLTFWDVWKGEIL